MHRFPRSASHVLSLCFQSLCFCSLHFFTLFLPLSFPSLPPSSLPLPPLQQIEVELNDTLTAMVTSMPKVMESTVASSLGLPGEFDSTSDLVQAYVDDFVHDPLLTLSSSSTYSTDASTSPVTPLTVGFIGVGHMGSGKKKKKKNFSSYCSS